MPKAQLKAIDSKIAAIQSAQRADLQLKLFPDWPDDRRRSAQRGYPVRNLRGCAHRST
jgi:hypothetical protein